MVFCFLVITLYHWKTWVEHKIARDNLCLPKVAKIILPTLASSWETHCMGTMQSKYGFHTNHQEVFLMVITDYIRVPHLNTTQRNTGLTCIPFKYKSTCSKSSERERCWLISCLHTLPTFLQVWPNWSISSKSSVSVRWWNEPEMGSLSNSVLNLTLCLSSMSDHGQSVPSSGSQFSFLQSRSNYLCQPKLLRSIRGTGDDACENTLEKGQRQQNTQPQVAA